MRRASFRSLAFNAANARDRTAAATLKDYLATGASWLWGEEGWAAARRQKRTALC